MLNRMNLPLFHLTFQLMIFSALLECSTGSIHAVNERIASAYRARRASDLPNAVRFTVAGVLLFGSIFLADHFGLVTLIAKGYRVVAYVMLAVFVVPLMTIGIARLWPTLRARPCPSD
jgi:uncharacterized membrane protein YkvI